VVLLIDSNFSDLLKRHVAGHEGRSGERNNKRLKVQHQASGSNRVTQACEACAGMHLKCEEKKPCKRCVKKNIECRSDVLAAVESEESISLERSKEQQAPSDPNNDTQYETAIATDEYCPAAQVAPVNGQPPLEFSNEDIIHHQQDTASLTDYLGGVLPNFSDPFSALFSIGIPSGTFTPRGVSGFGFESNIELDDVDLSFLDSYNTEIPFCYGGSPNNVFLASTPADSTNSAESYRSAALGAQAYEKSYWKFKPKRQQSGFSEEHNLSLPIENSEQDSPESRISLPRRITPEKLDTRTRDGILAVIVGSCKRENLSRALASFPSVDLLDTLLQFYLSSPIARPDSFIHTATLDTRTSRPEFLAAMISCGAVMTSDPALTKLGLAMQESVRIAVPRIVSLPTLLDLVRLIL
jgi:hypothetical protein